MPEYRFTPEAENDLQQIIDYTLEQWGKAQARDYVDGLEALAGQLADNPGLGTDRDQLIQGLLSFPYESHVLYYLRQAHGMTIIRVLHKRMDVEHL